MKTVFVGDIHGKWEMVEKALAMDGKKIFLGDFIDSWNRSVEDHKKCYDLYFEAHKKGEADAVFGNHELSYLIPEHQCSGWDEGRKALIVHYKDQIWDSFKPYILLDTDFLVSHGGLTEPLWDNANLTLETLPKWLDDGWKDVKSPVHNIGHCRGGMNSWGGIFWATWGEDFHPIPELTQVVGHTRGKTIRQDGNNFCVDCLDWTPEFLILDV